MVKYLDKNSGFSQWMANRPTAKPDSKPSKLSTFFWWLIVFLLAWWLFSSWLAPKPQVAENAAADNAPLVNLQNVPVSKIENNVVSADIRGLRISDINLLNYKQSKKSDDSIALFVGNNEYAEVGLIASGTTAPAADTVWKSARNLDVNAFVWRNSDGIDFRRTVKLDGYVINVRDEIKNNSKRDVAFAPYVRMTRAAEKNSAGVATGGIAWVNSDIERESWSRMESKPRLYQTDAGFVGFADQYWETIAQIGAHDQTVRMMKSGALYSAAAAAAPIRIAAGTTGAIDTKIFAGPRDQTILNTANAEIPNIGRTMDYGWFWFLSRPMLWLLNIINAFIMNYGVSIIILTIALRLLMWPLTRKSYTSMAAMQKMQPEMQRIQKLYANDRARQQMELMRLYQSHKTSPMSGCLPMLLQIPIFFALYKALLISVPMRMSGFLWISDLAVMDPYFILPILMGATMWYQQHLQGASTPASDNKNDPMAATQRMMKWMPVIFTVMFAWMPAGLVLYWTVSNMFGIIQMYIIKKTMK